MFHRVSEEESDCESLIRLQSELNELFSIGSFSTTKTLLAALVGRKALADKVVGRRADPLAVLQSHLGAHPMISPASSARIPAEFGKLYQII